MKASENQKILIGELTILYQQRLEKIIDRIFKGEWKLKVLTDEFFSIVSTDDLFIKFDFDNIGDISINTLDLFYCNLILLNNSDNIKTLKAIIKLHENKEELNKLIKDFMSYLQSFIDSYNILKEAGK